MIERARSPKLAFPSVTKSASALALFFPQPSMARSRSLNLSLPSSVSLVIDSSILPIASSNCEVSISPICSASRRACFCFSYSASR